MTCGITTLHLGVVQKHCNNFHFPVQCLSEIINIYIFLCFNPFAAFANISYCIFKLTTSSTTTHCSTNQYIDKTQWLNLRKTHQAQHEFSSPRYCTIIISNYKTMMILMSNKSMIQPVQYIEKLYAAELFTQSSGVPVSSHLIHIAH